MADSEIEKIARFAFPSADGNDLGEKVALVEGILRMDPADRSRAFYLLFKKNGIKPGSIDEAVAYMAVIEHFEPGKAKKLIAKRGIERQYLVHALCAAAVVGNREFLEKEGNLSYQSEPIKDMCLYLLQRM